MGEKDMRKLLEEGWDLTS